jgi:CRP/FNR family cyclic AMP-dependent transcriptional regulator
MSLDTETTLKLLGTVKLFDGFGPADLEAFCERSSSAVFVRAERIFAEGEPGRQLYVILSGKVEISRRAGTRTQQLMRLGPGETFGEMALVLPSGVGRSASVTAAEHTSTLSINRERLEGIPDVAAKVYANIARILASRLKMATDIVVLQAQTGANVPPSETIGPLTAKRRIRNFGG